jgi:hypothetical protein
VAAAAWDLMDTNNDRARATNSDYGTVGYLSFLHYFYHFYCLILTRYGDANGANPVTHTQLFAAMGQFGANGGSSFVDLFEHYLFPSLSVEQQLLIQNGDDILTFDKIRPLVVGCPAQKRDEVCFFFFFTTSGGIVLLVWCTYFCAYFFFIFPSHTPLLCSYPWPPMPKCFCK